MIHIESYQLWKSTDQGVLEYYNDGLDGRAPAMLVVPGGGYSCVCYGPEGRGVAERFLREGFRCFVLRYRCCSWKYPAPQQDILRAVRIIRSRAGEWGVIPGNIAVCGFSAGAHLCLSAGTLFHEIEAGCGDEADRESGRPDAMLLSYPVVTFGPEGHQGSAEYLLGDRLEELRNDLSLEKRILPDTPPAYIWHTAEDALVPVENSIMLFRALREKNIPAELHIYPHGHHGMQLGYGRQDIVRWPEEAVLFLRDSCGFALPEKKIRRSVVLTFDDACRNHLTYVAPLLKKYGFGATFFICRFNDEWRSQHSAEQLTGPEIRQLSDMGFEIGNHSWGHPCMNEGTDAENEEEIRRMEQFLKENHIPKPVSFAYPGGPCAENIYPLLRKYGLKYARTTERRLWNPGTDNPLRIPAYAIEMDSTWDFYGAVTMAAGQEAAVLVFHGIPDHVHPWVTNTPEIFESYLKYLAEHDYQVLSLKDFAARS